jgi:hypothetical protein
VFRHPGSALAPDGWWRPLPHPFKPENLLDAARTRGGGAQSGRVPWRLGDTALWPHGHVHIRTKPGHFARFRSFALNVLRANVHTSLLNAVLNDQPHIAP